MFKRILALAASCIVLQASPSHSQTQALQALCDQPFDGNAAALHERIKGSPGANEAVSRNPDLEVINFRGALWNFMQAGLPAHPSVACRRIVQIDGQMRVETQLHCSAAKAACDRLAESYRVRDREMMEAIKRQQPKR